jgi:hypothetical protein
MVQNKSVSVGMIQDSTDSRKAFGKMNDMGKGTDKKPDYSGIKKICAG